VAEQRQPWGDHTLRVTPQDPWADPPATAPVPEVNPFQRGVASVDSATPRTEPFTAAHDLTGTRPGAEPPQRRPMRWHVRRLRQGSEWSNAAVLFAFVCWGIWAISSDGDLTTGLLVFVVSLVVAVGLFALTRMLGRLVLEKQLGRVRHTARGAHLVAAVFMVGVGFAHLRQTEWVMGAWNWIAGLFA
jgi:hypothetical protein